MFVFQEEIFDPVISLATFTYKAEALAPDQKTVSEL